MGLLEEEDVDVNQSSGRISEITVNLTSCDSSCCHVAMLILETSGTAQTVQTVNRSCELSVHYNGGNSAKLFPFQIVDTLENHKTETKGTIKEQESQFLINK